MKLRGIEEMATATKMGSKQQKRLEFAMSMLYHKSLLHWCQLDYNYVYTLWSLSAVNGRLYSQYHGYWSPDDSRS